MVVVGMGNVLTGDDALGPTVVRMLDALWTLPPYVETVDAGTPGMDLAGLLAEVDAAIVVDTVTGDEPPGTIKRYDREQLLSRPLQPRTNPHAPGLAETLFSLDLMEAGPGAVVLIGVIPKAVEVGTPLSCRVEAALPAAVAAVVRELASLGAPPSRRRPPVKPDLWWQRSPALSGRR
jgi:hydrogenase maturation protease